MIDGNWEPAAAIERLEDQIEELHEAIQRSRRLSLVGWVGAIAGPAMLLALALGALEFTPVRLMLGIALALGGLVLAGASKTSTEQLELSLRLAESERRSAIDRLDFVRPGEGQS
jgi:hypothetical protein